MDAKRYLLVPALIIDNEIIPIWDEKIKAEKQKDYGEYYLYDDDFWNKHYRIEEVIFDVKTKKLSMGIVLNFYQKPNYSIGEKVMHETSNHVLDEATIKDVVYIEYESSIKKGSKIDKGISEYYLPNDKNETEINPNYLYEIRVYKASYILDNSKRCDWEHYLYKINKKDV